ncbi:MAG TPA: RNA polymerase factor sigma-32 [Polyangiaceae bacterium]|nr:RNA polymerase factor sigma-32 [Polyangiaceae bacterium]
MAHDADPSMTRYIATVQAYPQLTREEEYELAKAWADRQDEAAADKLVRAHLRYVVAIALKYRRYGVPLSELIAEGNFGVIHALKKFQPERGNRFVTYAAYWIRAYVLNYVIRSWSLVGAGSGALRSKMFFKLRREKVRVQNLVGDGDEADEMLAQRLGLPKEQVQAMLRRLESRDLSLDAKVFDDSATSVVDTLVAPGQDQEQSLANTGLRDKLHGAVREAVKDLDDRERFIVEKRLMADPEEELSLAELGRRLGVSRERARQLEARAKKKLRGRLEPFASDEFPTAHARARGAAELPSHPMSS